MSYCTIEEAWGSNFNERKSKKSSNRKDKLNVNNDIHNFPVFTQKIFSENSEANNQYGCSTNSNRNRNRNRKMIPQQQETPMQQYQIPISQHHMPTMPPNMQMPHHHQMQVPMPTMPPMQKQMQMPAMQQQNSQMQEMQEMQRQQMELPVQIEMHNNETSDNEDEYTEEEFNYLKSPIMNNEYTSSEDLDFNYLNTTPQQVMPMMPPPPPQPMMQQPMMQQPMMQQPMMQQPMMQQPMMQQQAYQMPKEEEFKTSMDEYNYKLDLFLYIFSGIILIFIMDTFVRIGMTINAKKMSHPDYILTNIKPNLKNK